MRRAARVAMTESSSSLHPALQKLAAIYRRRLRLLGLIVFFVMSSILLFVMVAALTSQDLGSLLTLGLTGLLLLPGVALAGGAIWYADREATKELDSANQLVLDCAPQTARLVSIESIAQGNLAELILPTEVRIYAVFEKFLRPLPLQGIEVQLYARQLMQGGALIALRPDGVALLGSVVEPKAVLRRDKWLQIILWVLIGANLIHWLYQKYGSLH